MTLSIIIKSRNTGCTFWNCYAECRLTECRFAECRGAPVDTPHQRQEVKHTLIFS
jgi:hypothetical protein